MLNIFSFPFVFLIFPCVRPGLVVFLNTWKATFVPAIICFRVFGTTALESGWLHFLLTEVFAILAGLDPSSEKPPDASKKIYILGRPACLKGSSKLLGIGSGRVGRLRKGLMGDNPVCPSDARLRKAGRALAHPPKQTVKRQLIHEFLMELYIRHSEPMPEVAADHGGRAQTSKPLKFRRLKGKRPRKFTKRDAKLTETQAQALRLLPPGHYTDWLRLFHAKHETCKVSLKLFCRVTQHHCCALFSFFFGQYVCLQ